jgi:hypothetical protein
LEIGNTHETLKSKLADLDDFDFDEPTTLLHQSNTNTSNNSSLPLSLKSTPPTHHPPTLSSKHVETSKTTTTPSGHNKKPQQSLNLADLDDFDSPIVIAPTKQTNLNKQQPTKLANSSTMSASKLSSNCITQSVSLPSHKLSQVLGKDSLNLKVIQDVTHAELELLPLDGALGHSHNERTILIRGNSIETTEFALELLQSVINNPSIDLLNLLPSNSSSPDATNGFAQEAQTTSSTVSNKKHTSNEPGINTHQHTQVY